MRTRMLTFLAVLALGAVICLPGMAIASSTFFGEDLSGGSHPQLALHPNADAARISFLAGLSSYGTETFDSISSPTSGPISLNFGWVTGTASSGSTLLVTNGYSGEGTYAISPSNYLLFVDYSTSNINISANVSFDFSSQPVRGFGFYGTGIGDFGEQLKVHLNYADSTTEDFLVPHTVDSYDAFNDVLYFGVIGSKAISSLDLLNVYPNTGNWYAGMGFDDFTAGQVPLPGALVLLGAGLVRLVGYSRRKKALI
jgi:hypothetical protein